MDLRLTDKVDIATGAASGIGQDAGLGARGTSRPSRPHRPRRMSRAAVPAVPAVPAMLGDGDGGLVHVGSDSARLPEIGNMDYAAADR